MDRKKDEVEPFDWEFLSIYISAIPQHIPKARVTSQQSLMS